LAVLAALASSSFSSPSQADRRLIADPANTSARVEYFVDQQKGADPWPMTVLLYGLQNDTLTLGGQLHADRVSFSPIA
jgi:hypothetical protein